MPVDISKQLLITGNVKWQGCLVPYLEEVCAIVSAFAKKGTHKHQVLSRGTVRYLTVNLVLLIQ